MARPPLMSVEEKTRTVLAVVRGEVTIAEARLAVTQALSGEKGRRHTRASSTGSSLRSAPSSESWRPSDADPSHGLSSESQLLDA